MWGNSAPTTLSPPRGIDPSTPKKLSCSKVSGNVEESLASWREICPPPTVCFQSTTSENHNHSKRNVFYRMEAISFKHNVLLILFSLSFLLFFHFFLQSF